MLLAIFTRETPEVVRVENITFVKFSNSLQRFHLPSLFLNKKATHTKYLRLAHNQAFWECLQLRWQSFEVVLITYAASNGQVATNQTLRKARVCLSSSNEKISKLDTSSISVQMGTLVEPSIKDNRLLRFIEGMVEYLNSRLGDKDLRYKKHRLVCYFFEMIQELCLASR